MKAAIYCRLSEEDRNKANKDDDSNSIKNQKAMLMQYAISKGWDLFDIYSDDDYAGSDRNRPQFKRLLADAQANKFDIILCKTQSRFTRELELVEKYIHGLFPIWGIRFVSIVDNADTDNKGNKKSRQINGLVNEWYLEDMSENIRSVLTSRRENGFHIGAFAPYGYAKDPDVKGHLVIDEEAAAIVREIFNMFADGYGKTTIAKILNERGLPNPTEYKRQKGLRYTQPPKQASMLWKYASIAGILENEVYIGNLVQGRYESISYKTRQNRPRPKDRWIRVEGTHEPIIDQQLWSRVQRKVKLRAKPNKETGMVHLFSGIAVCMYCGYNLRIHKCHGLFYHQCETKLISEKACPGAFIPEAELERIVIDEIRRLNQELLDLGRVERETNFMESLNAQKSKILAEQKGYQAKAQECDFAIRQLYIDRTRGIVSPKDFFTMSDGFQEEKMRFEGLVMSCQERINDIEARIQIGDHRLELLSQYVNVEHLSKNMLEILVDHIEVGKRNKATKQVPITIHWNF